MYTAMSISLRVMPFFISLLIELLTQSGSDNDEEGRFDVLQKHYNNNRAPCPPSPTYLQQIAAKTGVVNLDDDDDSSSSSDDEEQDNVAQEDEDGDSSKTRRVPRYTYTAQDAPARSVQLKFYPPQWRRLLTVGKDFYRNNIVGKNPFIGRSKGLAVARECLNEAYEYFRDNDLQVEEGTCQAARSFQLPSLMSPLTGYIEYEEDMILLVSDTLCRSTDIRLSLIGVNRSSPMGPLGAANSRRFPAPSCRRNTRPNCSRMSEPIRFAARSRRRGPKPC